MNDENTTKSDSPPSRPVTPADELIAYLRARPEERLWQAIRNWANQDYILFGNLSNNKGGKDFATLDGVKVYIRDTYHFSGKES